MNETKNFLIKLEKYTNLWRANVKCYYKVNIRILDYWKDYQKYYFKLQFNLCGPWAINLLGTSSKLGCMSKWTYSIERTLSRLLAMVERLYVFSNFMDENDLSYAHDETGILPNVFNAILINGKRKTDLL